MPSLRATSDLPMPPHWLIVLLVAGVVALPVSVVFPWLAIRLAEWYWSRGEKIVRND